MKLSKTAARDVVIAVSLIVLWALLVAVTNPRGDFPINDDWSYGRTVKILLEQHRLDLDGWNTATFALQALIGLLFCIPSGFSFLALRISTIVMGGIGVVGMYYLLRQIAARLEWALCGALALMLDPLYFFNSFNFMTDVHYTVLLIFSCLYLLKSIRDDSRRDEAIGVVLLCCATLIRQITLPVAVAYGLVVLFNRGMTWRNVIRAFLPALCVEALLLLYEFAIRLAGIAQPLVGIKQADIERALVQLGVEQYAGIVSKNFYSVIVYLCILLLPLTFAMLPKAAGKLANKLRGAPRVAIYSRLLSVVIAFFAAFYITIFAFTMLGNNLPWTLAFGPCILNGNRFLLYVMDSPRWLAEPLTHVIIALAVVITGCLLMPLTKLITRFNSLKNNFDAQVAAFALLALAGTILPFSLLHTFDRYTVPLMPLAALLLVACVKLFVSGDALQTLPRKRLAWATLPLVVAPLLLTGGLAVAGTHDFLEWNRARWKAVDDLIHVRGISPLHVDGGFEVTGWNLYASDEQTRSRFNDFSKGTKAMFIPEAPYVVTFDLASAPLTTCGYIHSDRYARVAAYPFSTWLMRRDLQIVVLQRCTE
jgi:hypothetical protein